MNTDRSQMGLRARKKLARHESILEAARQVIGDIGYENAKLEQIAEVADVGVATVYNYFGKKHILLFNLALYSIDRMEPQLDAWSPKPESTLEEALVEWIVEMGTHTFNALDHSIWGVVISEEYKAGVDKKDYIEIKQRFIELNLKFWRRLIASGYATNEVEGRDVAELLDSIASEVFRQAHQKKTVNRNTYRRIARRLVTLIVRGLAANQKE
ncbi:TetR/AcrR family transcriptional regulator [Rhizobium oryzihabitans]|uniref:TetR/AcrR family transcriptional regulator n=1 Tax=Rhizobium oryzihabitans TaxID=2267833 RepID=UPI0040359373